MYEEKKPTKMPASEIRKYEAEFKAIQLQRYQKELVEYVRGKKYYDPRVCSEALYNEKI